MKGDEGKEAAKREAPRTNQSSTETRMVWIDGRRRGYAGGESCQGSWGALSITLLRMVV